METLALPGRSQEAMCMALDGMRQGLSFALLGIDSDGGRALILASTACAGINDLLYCSCKQEHIVPTRSHSFYKYDQAHVEHTC